MKRLLLILILTSFSFMAHATRSRMNSLGQNVNQGSFYIEDNRNNFRNPANVGKIRNYIVAELEANEIAQKNLEGGIFGEFNSDIAFGIYLGKASVILNTIATIASISTATYNIGSFPTSKDANPLNAFLGGGSDLRWGLNVSYADSSADMGSFDNTYSNIGVAAGIETNGGLQVYVTYIIQNESTLGSPTEGYSKLDNSALQLGIIYPLKNDYTVWAQYGGSPTKVTGTSTEIKLEAQLFQVGIGKIFTLNPNARFNVDLNYMMEGVEDKAATGKKITKTTLPLVIGFEGSATEWLVLRGSISQGFILNNYKIENKGGENTTDPSKVSGTRVTLGAALDFNKIKIDGNLGGFGSNTTNSLFSTDFFINAAATYMF